MQLFWSSRSPFVRKVMVVAHEKGLADQIECVRTLVAPAKPNPEVMAANPLNKLPTLILDDGTIEKRHCRAGHDGMPEAFVRVALEARASMRSRSPSPVRRKMSTRPLLSKVQPRPLPSWLSKVKESSPAGK